MASDLVIVDADIPHLNGPETVGRLTGEFPGVATIGFSVFNDQQTRSAMLEAGADAYVSKKEGLEELVHVIYEVVS